ncbi:MAG: PHP domain-containing protein [Clostridia bacterium]|nr:PHP domain-containing protein [Clostridia bacterium]
MKKYLYELHLHTVQVSKCGVSTGAEHVRRYASLGYTGFVVTDHFFNGNCAVPRELPWEERVRLFAKGYEDAKKEGDKIGFQVWFGFEFQCKDNGWNHFPTYGISPETMIAHPEIETMNVEQFVKWVHREGGYVVQAHPFRLPGSDLIILAKNVDAVEVLNANRPDEENDLALGYAKLFGHPAVYGSDCHNVKQKRRGAISSDVKFETIDQMFAAIKAGETENEIIMAPELPEQQ